MKFLSTLLLASIAVSPAFAQKQKNALQHYIKQNPKHYQTLYAFMNQSSLAAKMKTTGIKQRVIASSGYHMDSGVYSITDSTKYFYNGSNYRGSMFDYNMMTYDYSYAPVNYPTFSAPSFFGITSVNQPLEMADSVISMSDDGNGNMVAWGKEVGTYLSNSTKISDYKNYNLTAGVADTGVRYTTDYDGQGRPSVITGMLWSGTNSAWDTFQKRTIYYDGSGVQQNDSIDIYSAGTWTRVAAIKYNYTSNNLTQINIYDFNGSTWTMSSQYSNTYTSGNQLKTSTYSVDTGGPGLMTAFIDSFAYTNGSAFSTYWKSTVNIAVFGGPNSLMTAFIYEKHLNAQGLPDSTHLDIQISGDSGWQSFTYNASNNPILDVDYISGDTSKLNYYYEDYNDLAVNNVPKVAANITVYPNPATDLLNIRWDNYKAGTPVSIRIVNAAGQTVRSESFSWKQTTESFSMGNLQAGVYWISIADNAGNMLLNQSVIKQ